MVRISIHAFPACVVFCGQSVMVTSPLVTIAAAIKGPALDKSGSINQSFDLITVGSIFQLFFSIEETFTPT